MKATIAIHRQLAGVSLAAVASFALAGIAQAQTAPVPAQPEAVSSQTDEAEAQRVEDLVVTGSRITTSGFNAPTPTTVIGEEQIANNAQPNIFNTIAQLPSLQGSTGAATGTFSVRINALCPLAEIAAAHRRAEENGRFGRVIVTID